MRRLYVNPVGTLYYRLKSTDFLFLFYFCKLHKNNSAIPKKQVPQEIMRPDYAVDGIPKDKSPMLPWVIEVKKEADIEGMRAAGRVARLGQTVSCYHISRSLALEFFFLETHSRNRALSRVEEEEYSVFSINLARWRWGAFGWPK